MSAYRSSHTEDAVKAVSIIGFKNSGKTTCTALLADALEARGLTVAVAKHTHHSLDKAETDTARLMKPGRTVIGIAEGECAVFWSTRRHLADLLPLVCADVLLVEGGKSLGWLPRVLCLREAGEAQALDRGLALATFGGVGAEGLPRFDAASVEALAELVAERGFVLPGLDCGACGQQDCAGFARMVVAHQAVAGDCCSVDGPLSVTVNGHQLGLNPFVARIVSGALKGMLAELKGYSPGAEVVIRLAE
ncbi:molybdopterin-guanine dinucleotide biosynthesis protein MobB [Nitratidesulfovibrio sp.]|uniref:molybdopterin-guanine dinucleotide biosynthesis protein MobB n=1 Tax=Nitratidesulfovibrio sp. TaxID=2802297 RepID=UPI003342CBBC